MRFAAALPRLADSAAVAGSPSLSTVAVNVLFLHRRQAQRRLGPSCLDCADKTLTVVSFACMRIHIVSTGWELGKDLALVIVRHWILSKDQTPRRVVGRGIQIFGVVNGVLALQVCYGSIWLHHLGDPF